MIFVIGGNGLVGSAIVRHLATEGSDYRVIQKENKNEFWGQQCDILIYANGNALKYKANEDPSFDFHASVASLADYIHRIKFKKFVHISTVDVYDNPSSFASTTESIDINTAKLSSYGFHKLLAENYTKHFCRDYLIFRLPGLVGKGLTKNPVYDFIHSHKKVMISKNSSLNFIHTDFIAESIFEIAKLGIKNEVFNLAANSSIEISKIASIIGYDSNYCPDSEQNLQNYNINVDKISKYITLKGSEEAIEKYYEEL